MLPPEMRSIGRSHAIRFLLSVLYGIKPQNPLEFVAVIRTIHATQQRGIPSAMCHELVKCQMTRLRMKRLLPVGHFPLRAP